jgi:hypothetical protein
MITNIWKKTADPFSLEQDLWKYVCLKMVIWPKHVAQLNKIETYDIKVA